MKVCSPISTDVNALDGVAIALTVNNEHSGIYYRPRKENKTRLCHLLNHYVLKDVEAEDSSMKYRWVENDLHLSLKLGLIAQIKNIMKFGKIKPVPYSFIDYGASFDPRTGEYQNTELGSGLTCATFILDVFTGLQIHLIDKSTWGKRDEDEAWKNKILKMVNVHADDDHKKVLRDAEEFVRYKPSEVACSFGIEKTHWPVTFQCMEEHMPQLMA
jgi:hypothetical protein